MVSSSIRLLLLHRKPVHAKGASLVLAEASQGLLEKEPLPSFHSFPKAPSQMEWLHLLQRVMFSGSAAENLFPWRAETCRTRHTGNSFAEAGRNFIRIEAWNFPVVQTRTGPWVHQRVSGQSSGLKPQHSLRSCSVEEVTLSWCSPWIFLCSYKGQRWFTQPMNWWLVAEIPQLVMTTCHLLCGLWRTKAM